MAPSGLTILGIGLPKRAGVTEARVDYPLAALAAMPQIYVRWGSNGVGIPRDQPPGILMLHRQFLTPGSLRDNVERMIGRGWTIVSDIDDDPHHWRPYVESNFHAFRGVHAVTVSTPPLVAMIRQWNPQVMMFPNALPALPDIAPSTPKHGRLKVFFGALNREGDWAAIMESIGAAALRLGDEVEFVVVHDQGFFDQLPNTTPKTFHPTLAHDQYMRVMAQCDLALLPLADTPFNLLKSDLKFIECCGAGVVPICSPTVYNQVPEHRDIGLFVEEPQAWGRALLDLCKAPEDIARRRRLGLNYVSVKRMHHHQAPIRAAYYRGLMLQRPRLEAERQARLAASPT